MRTMRSRQAMPRCGPARRLPSSSRFTAATSSGPCRACRGEPARWHGRSPARELVLANSSGVERLARRHGATATRVVHLGTDLPVSVERSRQPLIATVAHLVARKRHAEVMRALVDIPQVRYLIIGDGPERAAIERLAVELGISDRVELAGQLPHQEALARARTAWAFVMPSVDEAFGVAYIEAMAAGVPAIGCAGEPGPEEIAAAGEGIVLVARGRARDARTRRSESS